MSPCLSRGARESSPERRGARRRDSAPQRRPGSRRWAESLTWASALSVGLCALGCAGGEAVEVTLSVDPAISSESDLASSLSELTFILDSAEGLYPAGSERVSGDLRVENADSDPELEIVTNVAVQDSHLPVVRIERGGLSVTSVDLRVLGKSKETGEAVADGGALGLSFSSDARPESVPFNFRDSLRPPRVSRLFPESGREIQGCDLQVLTLVFSRPMDPASLTPESVLVGPQGTATTKVAMASSGLVADVTFTPPISGDGSRVVFDLQVTSAARAEDGTRLDQAGSEPGDQPFESLVRLDCGPPPSFPCDMSTCPWSCGVEKECLHLPQIECVEGVCTPTKCVVECGGGSVCDPVRDACLPDCRTGDALSACASGACDPATGLCGD